MKNISRRSTRWRMLTPSLNMISKNPNPNQTLRKKTWWGSWTWSEHSNKTSINRKKLISRTNYNINWKKINNPRVSYNINNRCRNWRNQKPAMMSKLINKKRLFKRKTKNFGFGKRRWWSCKKKIFRKLKRARANWQARSKAMSTRSPSSRSALRSSTNPAPPTRAS